MAKLPKWKREFNNRMAAQLRLFLKTNDNPAKLTRFTYTNGEVICEKKKFYRSAWGRRVRNYRKEDRSQEYEYRWVPKECPRV